jgi:hypothetical protein
MSEHDLKCWPAYFSAVLDGRKTFELRKNDRGYREGDVLLLREYDPDHLYTGRELRRVVTYVLFGGGLAGPTAEALSGDYVILGLAAPSPASASGVTLEEILVDAEQRKAEIAKLISEVLHERDKVEVMAKRADRYLSRAEAAEAEVVKLRALSALPASAPPPVPMAKRTDDGWLVVRQRETDPPEVWKFTDEAEARAFHDRAQMQWSDCYLARVVKQGAQIDALPAASPTVSINQVGDAVCEHGTAMDVHCCHCHSGFIFDTEHECPPPPCYHCQEGRHGECVGVPCSCACPAPPPAPTACVPAAEGKCERCLHPKDWHRRHGCYAVGCTCKISRFAEPCAPHGQTHCMMCALTKALPTEDGAARIAAERRRQVEREGWTPEHDDEHENGELLAAAVKYIDAGADVDLEMRPPVWPFEASSWKPSDDQVCCLTKAGALIAAEIDRLRRRDRPTSGLPVAPAGRTEAPESTGALPAVSQVTELIEQWRKSAANLRTVVVTGVNAYNAQAMVFDRCADELEALASQIAVSRETEKD